MTRFAIAMDLGTSGLRAQALDLSTGEVLSTAITTRHPLPGANVLDHVDFALEVGLEVARDIMIQAVNQVLEQLRVVTGDVERLAVCGNPAQLSLFQGMEVRDLAFAGPRKLSALGVTAPDRGAARRLAGEFPALALPCSCQVLIPPAVRHEVGADAIALILQTGLLRRGETAIAIDFGTNAELALVHHGRVFTGSAAAGPALEGQHLACGTLAIPGAISDLEPEGAAHRLFVLSSEMRPVPGALIDLRRAVDTSTVEGPRAVGITGTGTIATLDQAIQTGVVVLPRIRTADRRLHLGQDLFVTEADLAEAGKAIGAIRAGYVTLSVQAGITPGEIHAAYLAGASGTYLDALKARRLGLIPPHATSIRQVGNTSLAMARALALEPKTLDAMSELARELQQTHCMFGSSRTFASLFLLELSHWTEGMPMSLYGELLRRGHLPELPPPAGAPEVLKTVKQDLDDPGRLGLVTLKAFGRRVALQVDGCTACMACVSDCPAGALSATAETEPPTIALALSLCDGVACRRCERSCPTKVLHMSAYFGAATRHDVEVPGERTGG